MSIVSVGALLVQALVNGFGSAFIAGYSSAVRIHQFMSTAINTMGSAVSTYTAQNIGANRYDRVTAGIKAALTVMISICLVLIVVIYAFGGNIVGLFSEDPSREALDAGVFYLRLVVVGMVPFCLFNCFNGVARGAGYMPAFTVSTLSDLAVRVMFAYAFVGLIGRNVIAISVVIGWIVGTVIATSYYFTGRWKNAKQI